MTKIMVVDDEESARITTRLVLEKEGYEVLEAPSASECWHDIIIRALRPDLILLDILMHGLRSTQLVERIEADKNLKSIKIIYVTAVKDAKSIVKKTKSVAGIIAKPYENKELIAMVKKALK